MSQPRDDATVRPGPTNSLLDITGLRVGHVTRREPGWLTGTTVVLAPEEGVVAGVDVRGGGPGTRETDLLDPRNVVERVHAICLSGGSAFAAPLSAGLLLGNGLQESVHHRLHDTRPLGSWLEARRRLHGFHHFRDERRGYGTLTDFWDHVFGTLPPRG